MWWWGCSEPMRRRWTPNCSSSHVLSVRTRKTGKTGPNSFNWGPGSWQLDPRLTPPNLFTTDCLWVSETADCIPTAAADDPVLPSSCAALPLVFASSQPTLTQDRAVRRRVVRPRRRQIARAIIRRHRETWDRPPDSHRVFLIINRATSRPSLASFLTSTNKTYRNRR